VLSVPSGTCLIVDYQAGLRLPQAPWPRLRKGLHKDDAMPWDLLLVMPLPPCSALCFVWLASAQRWRDACDPHSKCCCLPLGPLGTHWYAHAAVPGQLVLASPL
jgi:hypothetical protein